MSRNRQAFFLPILILYSAILGWSAGHQSGTTPAEAQAKQESKPAPSAQESAGKKLEKNREHKFHVRLGTVTVGAGYSRFLGRGFGYPYELYPFGYSPMLRDPFWGTYSLEYYPGYFSGYQAGEGKGEIKLSANLQRAEVFLDGAYAGHAQDLKNFWLDPGAYDLTVRAENCPPFNQRIYVLTGKTLKITATIFPRSATEVKP